MKALVGLLVLCCLISVSFANVIGNCRDSEECRDHKIHPDYDNHIPKTRGPEAETNNDYWLKQGMEFVQNQITREFNNNTAKNVIMFLGDGMGLTTLAAARVYLGGEEKQLSFEKFPHIGLSKTYSIDYITPDSACTATAYLCGVKAMYGTIGVNGQIIRKDCAATLATENHVTSIAQWAINAGKSAGLVTTTRVTHASPAGVYAHIADRDWENDDEVKKNCGGSTQIKDIAYQLVHGETGSKLKVIMGGGRSEFRDSALYSNGLRTDRLDLIDDWHKSADDSGVYVESVQDLLNVKVENTDRLLGLFADSHMKYHLEDDKNAPTLSQMTQKAIEMLQKDKNGYFLFVEGGKIDLAHHDTEARMAIDETAEFSKAIELARELTNLEDTLIVVTSDHSHTLSVSGYPDRHNDIFGNADTSDKDNLPYRTLSYANGNGYDTYYDTKEKVRRDPREIDNSAINAPFPSTVPLDSETHGGEDVGVFASGPWSHLFTGVYEQNVIPHLMAYAMCVGDGHKACD